MEHVWEAGRHLVLNMLICKCLTRHSRGDDKLVGYIGLDFRRAV